MFSNCLDTVNDFIPTVEDEGPSVWHVAEQTAAPPTVQTARDRVWHQGVAQADGAQHYVARRGPVNPHG